MADIDVSRVGIGQESLKNKLVMTRYFSKAHDPGSATISFQSIGFAASAFRFPPQLTKL